MIGDSARTRGIVVGTRSDSIMRYELWRGCMTWASGAKDESRSEGCLGVEKKQTET